MNDKISRPISIWITQFIFVILIIMVLISLIQVLKIASNMPMIGLIIGISFSLGIIILLVFSFWGLAKRMPFSRWLSVGILSFFFVASLLGKLSQNGKGAPIEYYEYSNNTQMVAGAITQIVIYGLLLSLIAVLVRSKKVKHFFAGTTAESESISLLQ